MIRWVKGTLSRFNWSAIQRFNTRSPRKGFGVGCGQSVDWKFGFIRLTDEEMKVFYEDNPDMKTYLDNIIK